MKKTQIWVSVIIYMLVAVITLSLILAVGIPILTDLRERAISNKIKESMLEMDKQITTLASQGPGAQSKVSFEVKNGRILFLDNKFVWELETSKDLIPPKTSTKIGNLILTNNANVKTYETTTKYILETNIKNDTFRVVFNKIGSKDQWAEINTTKIIDYIQFNENKMNGIFTFTINGNESTMIGNGYTQMIPSGNNSYLGSAKVIAHISNDFGNYDLEFVLESYADFIKVNLKNIDVKNGN